MTFVTPAISVATQLLKLKLLNMLVPNFENNADAADNLDVFCALVCVPWYTTSSGQSDMDLSCRQVQMMHVVTTQPGLRLQLQNGSTTVTLPQNDLLPMGRKNVAFVTTLQAISFAQSIMIGIIPSELYACVSHSLA